VKQDRGEEDKQTSMSMNPVSKVAVRRGEDVKCRHFLGYLKKRPKDMQIPDECLTCDKMIQCLLK